MLEFCAINVDTGDRYIVKAPDTKTAIQMVKDLTGATTVKARGLISLHMEHGNIIAMQKEEKKNPYDIHKECSKYIQDKYGLTKTDADELAYKIIEKMGEFTLLEEFIEFCIESIQIYPSKKKAWKEYSDIYDKDTFEEEITVLPSGITTMVM